jgi:uncharacterized linocin/CFP29 family protein
MSFKGDTGRLTTAEVNYVEKQIVKAMLPVLKAETFMPKVPLGNFGFLKTTFYTEDQGSDEAVYSMSGEVESVGSINLEGTEIKIPAITKDFFVYGRDLAMSRAVGRDLNTQHAEAMARKVAAMLDKLCITGQYTGWSFMGIEGLATRTGRNTTAGGDWSANFLAYLNTAIGLLEDDSMDGPKKLVILNSWWRQLTGEVITNTESLKAKLVYDLLGGAQNVIVTSNLFTSAGAQTNALVIDTSPGNFEIQVAEDIRVIGPDRIPGSDSYKGKVRIAAVPVIKRPTAICEITALT